MRGWPATNEGIARSPAPSGFETAGLEKDQRGQSEEDLAFGAKAVKDDMHHCNNQTILPALVSSEGPFVGEGRQGKSTENSTSAKSLMMRMVSLDREGKMKLY